MKKVNIKSRYFWVLGGALVIFGVLFYRDSLAKIAWQKLRSANVAIFLTKDAKFATEIGNYYFNGGAYDLRKAEKAYEKAASLDSKVLWAHYRLARVYFLAEDFDVALREINKEIEINSLDLRPYYVRGLIYAYRKDFKSAEENFKQYILWMPGEWAGYNDLAWVLSSQDKYSEAESVVKNALQKTLGGEKNPWLWNSLGVAELNLGKRENAKISFLRAREFAESLKEDDWRRAYPGNNFRWAVKGIEEFKKAIEENIKRSDVDK